jgi:hypothetical protein
MSMTSSRLAGAVAVVAAALALPGCGGDLFSGVDGPFICTLDCGGERPPDGTVRTDPELANMVMGDKLRVTVTLQGPIVNFSSMDWRSLDSKVIRVLPLPCGEAQGDRRTCAAEVVAVGPGRAEASFSANLRPSSFAPVYGQAFITVTER